MKCDCNPGEGYLCYRCSRTDEELRQDQEDSYSDEVWQAMAEEQHN